MTRIQPERQDPGPESELLPIQEELSSGERRPSPARLALRIAIGVIVLAAVIWYSNPAALAHKLSNVNRPLFIAAVLVAAAASTCSAIRWGMIARALDLAAPTARLVRMYARGITVNMLLPGATLSGDLLRTYQLASLGNPILRSALSVFFDRFSGLWVLCVLSLLAAVGFLLLGGGAALPSGVWLYAVLLTAIVVAPFVPWPVRWLHAFGLRLLDRVVHTFEAMRSRLSTARTALLHSVWMSVAVQALSALTLWLCGSAVGVHLSYAAMLAAAAPIFITAALPIGVAGFGTRELAAVLVLGFLGVDADQATAASLLFGFCAVVQGIAAAPLFLFKT